MARCIRLRSLLQQNLFDAASLLTVRVVIIFSVHVVIRQIAPFVMSFLVSGFHFTTDYTGTLTLTPVLSPSSFTLVVAENQLQLWLVTVIHGILDQDFEHRSGGGI